MLDAAGIAEVARTGQPARVGNRVITIDDIIRATRGGDWVDCSWVELEQAAAEALAGRLRGTVVEEPLALPAGPAAIEGELVDAGR